MNCLITGGSGFIGSNLTLALRNAGHRVITIDLHSPKLVQPHFYVPGDITTPGLLEAVLRSHEIQVVIHLAAVSTIQAGMADGEKAIQTNLGGTRALLQALDATGHQAILIHASTDKVYGPLIGGTQYTEDTPLAPLSDSPYDWSEAQADKLVMDWLRKAPTTRGWSFAFAIFMAPLTCIPAGSSPGVSWPCVPGRQVLSIITPTPPAMPGPSAVTCCTARTCAGYS